MKKLRITIGIPAFNEEKNIMKLLESVLKQDESGYILDKIIVLSDGSNDRTVEAVQAMQDNKISVVIGKIREGKSARINELMQKLTSDVLVLLDADISLISSRTISKLVEPLIDKNVGLTGGRLVQENSAKFIEKSIGITLSVYEKYFKSINGGNNVFAVKGAILAITNQLAKQITIPREVFANDAYLYFACTTKGYKFKFVNDAIALYKVPATIKDQISQNARWRSSEKNLRKYFGNVIQNEYSRKNVSFFLLLIKAVIKDPIHCIAIFLLNFISKFYVQIFGESSSIWEVSRTTK